MSETKLIKLVSGEEIIASVEDGWMGNNTVTISDCLAVIPQPPQQGQPQGSMGFAFIPWGSLAADSVKFTIRREHVIYVAEPQAELIGRHQQLFGRIQTAPKGLMINKRN